MRGASLLAEDDLAAMLSSKLSPAVLDVRWKHGVGLDEAQYLNGHIPGASLVDLDKELCGPADQSGRRPIPHSDKFTLAMQRHGVSPHRPVVVYDTNDSTAAARAWWLLRYFGHPDVYVLDGGYQAWSRNGGPLETGPPRLREPGDFVAVPGGMPICDAEDAAALSRSGILIDARSRSLYLGAARPGDRVGGHIPGAVNVPTTEYSNPDGTILAGNELVELLETHGILAAQERPIATYCGSGISATHTVLALSVIGITAALYPGSWSHWVANPTRPVRTGSQPG
jgi:thiosulfate/3-mercaptopyruvate sulfurtransferase